MRLYQHGLAAAACAVAVIGTAALSLAQAPSKQAKIARAMQAAPESISKNATIVDGDGTVLRSGSNGWHCHLQPVLDPNTRCAMTRSGSSHDSNSQQDRFQNRSGGYFIHARRRRCC